MYDPDKCTGCGLCLEVCPHGVFVWSGKPSKKRTVRIADKAARRDKRITGMAVDISFTTPDREVK
ncbi:MAG: 4Fe-4S binding protein, partial [Acidobacteria bacterium]|nr:4Fe-4S binding protein [Acidobacteriota bacterium]